MNLKLLFMSCFALHCLHAADQYPVGGLVLSNGPVYRQQSLLLKPTALKPGDECESDLAQ